MPFQGVLAGFPADPANVRYSREYDKILENAVHDFCEQACLLFFLLRIVAILIEERRHHCFSQSSGYLGCFLGAIRISFCVEPGPFSKYSAFSKTFRKFHSATWISPPYTLRKKQAPPSTKEKTNDISYCPRKRE